MRHVPAILVALAGAAFIAYQWSGARPMWVDEEMIAINIRDRSLAQMTGALWLGQSAPLGWLMLQRVVLLVAGTSEAALRLVPAAFGAGTLAGAFWVGRRWMTPAGAFVFVLLFACGAWVSFFPLELKHYSADVFWALLLPGAAAWALEAAHADARRRRAIAWWLIAAAAHWLSNGGLLAAPGCAVVLFAATWLRHGAREAFSFALMGTIWLLSFAAYYYLSLGHTYRSTFLWRHWGGEVAPAGADLRSLFAWLSARFEPLARNPAGSGMASLLWLGAAAGLALGRARVLAAAFATLPLTAFILGAASVVPLYERFSLWMVPALYGGVAMLADRAVWLARDRGLRWPEARTLASAVLAALVIAVSADILATGLEHVDERRITDTNHGLQDRESVRWLLAQRRDGDALLTTRLGWPAIWWYGGLRPLDERPDAYEIGHRYPGPDCGPEQLRDAMRAHRRALIHIGFPDMSEGYGSLLLRHLDQLGTIAHYRDWGPDGFTAIVDLHTPHAEESSLALMPRFQDGERRLAGCIAVSPARLW